ncbi:MAG: LLM class flavin-dependent oxidoreductase, partial [Nonomuraea sp.]|nr:LLM class flavin-dependent oxidoreductase [Nonomuraea sp.]
MRLGITMFATDLSMPAHELARAAEERGFASLYLPEHTHIPVSRRTPAASGQAVLPDQYKRTLDPLVALAAAVPVTSTIRLGTGILLAAQREPIVTAKAIATL